MGITYSVDSLEIEDMKTEKSPNTLDCGTGKRLEDCLVETRRIPGHDKTARMTQADIVPRFSGQCFSPDGGGLSNWTSCSTYS